MTKEEIVMALRACSKGGGWKCMGCTYYEMDVSVCVDALEKDAADLIEAQEAELEALKAQVKGTVVKA